MLPPVAAWADAPVRIVTPVAASSVPAIAADSR